MVRLGYLMVLLAYTLVSIQRSDGKELPAPISEVTERLVDLEKRLLIQEEKNTNLEKRLVEQEILNKVQGDIIQKMAFCDCAPQKMATTNFSDESVNLYPTDVEHSQENASSVKGRMNESVSLHHTQNIHRHSDSF
uniref:Uncharacterized protein LOC111116240 n=1 Tax=Crassostrea virginica TaxID=6565 RepID=A0A8B8C5F0_CRAVI|nr:uncharacterized protein LOC111116240 [Crassostrea virginica]